MNPQKRDTRMPRSRIMGFPYGSLISGEVLATVAHPGTIFTDQNREPVSGRPSLGGKKDAGS